MIKKAPPLISDEDLLRDRRYDLFAVKVVSVDARDATNGRPPIVAVEVLERFRGVNRRKSLTVSWPAEPSTDELVLTDPKARAKWLSTPYAGPKVEATFIVLVERVGGVASSVLARCRYQYSPAERQRVLKVALINMAANPS